MQGPVQVGRPAPQFTATAIVDGRLKELSLAAYTEANHWLVLIFFPAAWTTICPSELRAFAARYEEFLYTRSCAVVFASTDSPECLRAWNNTNVDEGGLGDVHVPLVSDHNHTLSRDYGVLIEESGIAQRALFIIDTKGIVRAITINDVDVGRSVDETQRILDALAFKDEFGEGCPANWKKTDDPQTTIASVQHDNNHMEDASNAKSEPEDSDAQGFKKSWSQWARPKLQRAWSATSARSSGSFGTQSWAGMQSPLMSPTSVPATEARNSGLMQEDMGKLEAQMEEAMLDMQKLRNLEAAGLNQDLRMSEIATEM